MRRSWEFLCAAWLLVVGVLWILVGSFAAALCALLDGESQP